MALNELKNFCEGCLRQLALKYRVDEPKVRIGLMFTNPLRAGRYVPPTDTIIINSAFVKYLKEVRPIAGDVLRFILAHEWYHRSLTRGLSGLPLAKLLAKVDKREHQRKADEFAEAETGVPASMISTHLFALRLLTDEI